MIDLDVSLVRSRHAHVYFDAASRDRVWSFREHVVARSGSAARTR